MKLRFCVVCLTVSALACIAGLILVAVFSYLYVVPSRMAEQHIETKCRVMELLMLWNIFHVDLCVEQSIATNNTHAYDTEHTNPSFVEHDYYCWFAKVMYKRLDNSWRNGFLVDNDQYIGYFEVISMPEKEHCCNGMGCQETDVSPENPQPKTSQASHTNGTAKYQSLQYLHQTDENDKANLCVMFSAVGAKLTLKPGEEVSCLYKEYNKYSHVKVLPQYLLLNAIFWPTALFIVGFLGMFFSCVKMQYRPVKRTSFAMINTSIPCAVDIEERASCLDKRVREDSTLANTISKQNELQDKPSSSGDNLSLTHCLSHTDETKDFKD